MPENGAVEPLGRWKVRPWFVPAFSGMLIGLLLIEAVSPCIVSTMLLPKGISPGEASPSMSNSPALTLKAGGR